jgi:hypothetical protein
MEFLAPGNSARPEFLTPLQSVAPQCSVKDLAEFRRAGNSMNFLPPEILSRGGNSGPGAEFPALKQNFRPLKFSPLDDFKPFYSSPLPHLSSPSVLCNTWRIPAMLSTRLISLCCNQTPKSRKLGTCPFNLYP